MIGISEYNSSSDYDNIVNVRENDMVNFKEIFEKQLRYDFISNKSDQMSKEDVQEFFDEMILKHKLYKNTNNYDAVVVIICGHGDIGDALVTSDGKTLGIDQIRTQFDCNKMESLKDCPKVFIVDIVRGSNFPASYPVSMRGRTKSNSSKGAYYGHNDDGFLTVWSTTKGHVVSNSSLFSECLKDAITASKGVRSLHQMLFQLRNDIRSKKEGEWYCVESQDTTCYDIVLSVNDKR
ncbi:hypothetical protein RFI_10764 [Reticulomyxa filosa]|uniref:Caspase family p20 domain-containing protein n=1 Tax=Reticulomyxa filosa TaxID=46433 RepID=X6NKG3_RETFI|nr:hypothetical protein RFI_10764 [Reticulomyxa filosa]|eukprot:ETO26373.1 hypothetical protein RFI_10764 [Reticulomyxa filosa]